MRPDFMAALECGGSSVSGVRGRMHFDRAAWAGEHGNFGGDSRRSRMFELLEDAGVREGVSQDRVRDLLDAPDSSGLNVDIYFLGRDGQNSHVEVLRIEYAEGVVRAIRRQRS
jgi:hypothetical protein